MNTTTQKPLTQRDIARNIRRWIKALRSGEYTQGWGALLTDNGTFCCLGVAVACGATEEYLNFITLAADARSRLGLSFADQRWLIEMNDTEYTSFVQIADWLEQNHLPKFTTRGTQ